MAQSGEADANNAVVVNENVVPEPDKLDEVKHVETEFGKQYPHLHKRLGKGEVFVKPQEIMALVSETVDCLLQPLVPHKDKKAIFIVGSSGAGKSTFANWMLGSNVVHETVENEHGDEVTELQVSVEFFKVGHNLQSKTLVPNIQRMPQHPDTVLIDFPGFKDTTSLEIRLGIDVAFRQACKLFKNVHVLALISIHAFQDERGAGARAQLSKLMRVLPSKGMPLGADECASSTGACVWWMGITKCEKAFVNAPRRMFKEATALAMEEGYQHEVFDINKKMMGSDSSCSPGIFCEDLCAATHVGKDTPEGKHFSRAFASAFGPLPSGLPKVLLTDCLDGKDTERFQRGLMTQALTMQFTIELPPVAEEKVEEGSFADVVARLQNKREALKMNMHEIQEDAHAMAKGKLGMERRSELVSTLCNYHQCRLKSAFLRAEWRVLQESRQGLATLVSQYAELAQQLHKGSCMSAAELNQVTSEAKKIHVHIAEALRQEGYDGIEQHAAAIIASTGVLAAIGGAATAARLIYVGVSAAELFAGGLVTGLATAAGVASGVGIVVAVAGAAYHFWRQDQTRRVTDELMGALSDVKEAFDAITNHVGTFQAMGDNLEALRINGRD